MCGCEWRQPGSLKPTRLSSACTAASGDLTVTSSSSMPKRGPCSLKDHGKLMLTKQNRCHQGKDTLSFPERQYNEHFSSKPLVTQQGCVQGSGRRTQYCWWMPSMALCVNLRPQGALPESRAIAPGGFLTGISPALPDGPIPLLRGQFAGSLLFLLQAPSGFLQLGQRVRGRVGWHCGVLNKEMRGLYRVPELSTDPGVHGPRTLNGQGPGTLVGLLLLHPRRPLGAREKMWQQLNLWATGRHQEPGKSQHRPSLALMPLAIGCHVNFSNLPLYFVTPIFLSCIPLFL